MSGKFHKVVVASDSFKGCLSSMQVAEGVEAGIHMCCPGCHVVKLAVADGGEGTVDALLETMGGCRVSVEVSDPLGRPCMAEYAVLNDGVTAVMEMSSASGLPLLKPEERDPMKASTYGTGQMIADALDRGCRRFLVGIGGSATNDAGMGMMKVLGCRFLDQNGNDLAGCGESLSKVVTIDLSHIRPDAMRSEFIVACDVDSPFHGTKGAAYVYAPQKGATPEMVHCLDAGLKNIADVIARETGIQIGEMPGAGAAGGLGGAFKAFLNAELRRGSDMVLDTIGFDEIIKDADIVITGEGKIDAQTMTGKLPYTVAQRAGAQGIPVLAICGRAEIQSHPSFTAICPITPPETPLQTALQPSVAIRNLIDTVSEIYKKQKKL